MIGVRLIESPHAMAEPTGKAYTDDMSVMLDDLRRFGQIHKKPAAFKIPNGTMIVHPSIMAALRKQLAVRIDAYAERAFYGAPR